LTWPPTTRSQIAAFGACLLCGHVHGAAMCWAPLGCGYCGCAVPPERAVAELRSRAEDRWIARMLDVVRRAARGH
jgi:hypothetical protein